MAKSWENLPRRIKDSGRAPRTWNTLAPNTPGPKILKICSPPDATYDSPWNIKYSYTTIRNRWPKILLLHGKNPYNCSHSSEEYSIPLNTKTEDFCPSPSSTPSDTNSWGYPLSPRGRPLTSTIMKR